MKPKMNWRKLKFVPEGGDDSQAITVKQKGFMHLCDQLREGRMTGFRIHDTKGMFAKHGHNKVTIDWADFRKAFVKASMAAPPEKPSVFQGQYFPPEHSIDCENACLREFVVNTSRLILLQRICSIR